MLKTIKVDPELRGFTDWRDQPVMVGDHVLYPMMSGRSSFMVEGTLVELKWVPDEYQHESCLEHGSYKKREHRHGGEHVIHNHMFLPGEAYGGEDRSGNQRPHHHHDAECESAWKAKIRVIERGTGYGYQDGKEVWITRVDNLTGVPS